MGGQGSGSWYRYGTKNTTVGLLSLDINWLNRKGYLSPGHISSVHWTRNSEDAGNIGIRAADNNLLLQYRVRISDSDWEDIAECVLITRTPCHYGGSRLWFICPGERAGVPCGRRAGKLYSAGKYFLCRSCYNLAYESQRQPKRDSLLYKAQDIRKRLGGSPDLGYPFPLKPKGMHWKTYLRLRHQSEDAEIRSWIMVAGWLGINP